MASTKRLTHCASVSPQVLNPYHQIRAWILCNLRRQMCSFASAFPAKTPHVRMRMAAKVEFHCGSDEVREHLHSLDPLFFFSPSPTLHWGVWIVAIQHHVRIPQPSGSTNPPVDLSKQTMALIKPKSNWTDLKLIYCIVYLDGVKLEGPSEESEWWQPRRWQLICFQDVLNGRHACHCAPLDTHQRHNKWETERTLKRPRTNWMFMWSFLWGFSCCTRGWSDCVGSRHLLFSRF